MLKSAIPVFWDRGYADTGLHDLEQATGVNKSGLYAEFKSKEELFLASLRYYVEHIGAQAILSAEPLGWGNIERLAKMTMECRGGRKGCFGINSMRETAILPAEAAQNSLGKQSTPERPARKKHPRRKNQTRRRRHRRHRRNLLLRPLRRAKSENRARSPEQKIADLMTMLRSL